MGLFKRKSKSSTVSDTEQELAALSDRRAVLVERLSAAQKSVEDAIIRRRELLLYAADLNDDESARANQTVHAAEVQVFGLSDAIVNIDRQAAEAEAKLAAEKDRIAR